MLRHRFLQELLRQKAFDLTGLAGLEPTTYGLGRRPRAQSLQQFSSQGLDFRSHSLASAIPCRKGLTQKGESTALTLLQTYFSLLLHFADLNDSCVQWCSNPRDPNGSAPFPTSLVCLSKPCGPSTNAASPLPRGRGRPVHSAMALRFVPDQPTPADTSVRLGGLDVSSMSD